MHKPLHIIVAPRSAAAGIPPLDPARPGHDVQKMLKRYWTRLWAENLGYSASDADDSDDADDSEYRESDADDRISKKIEEDAQPGAVTYQVKLTGFDPSGGVVFIVDSDDTAQDHGSASAGMSEPAIKPIVMTMREMASGWQVLAPNIAEQTDRMRGNRPDRPVKEEDAAASHMLMEHSYVSAAFHLRLKDMAKSRKEQASGRGDFEHSHEDALKLLAAEETGLPVHVVKRRPDDYEEMFGLNGASEEWKPGTPAVFCGFGDPPAGALWPVIGRADRYWSLRPFRKMAGRFLIEVDPCDVIYVLASMARDGHKKAFVKDGRRKRGVWIVRLGTRSTPASIRKNLPDDLFEALVERRENEPFLVQQYIAMSHEYRIFVVDGRPVSGAPVLRTDCVHEPWMRGRFRPTVSHERDVGPAAEDRDLVAKYARLARQFTSLMSDECPDTRDYVLDLAVTDKSEVIVVELNNPGISGLYAADWRRILKAAVGTAERRMDIEERETAATKAAE